MGRCGRRVSRFRRRFRAQIPEPEAARHRRPHLTARGWASPGGPKKSFTAQFAQEGKARQDGQQLCDLASVLCRRCL